MLALETAPNGAGICVCVFKRIKKKYFKKQRLAICSPSSSLSSRFNSPTEVKEMTSGEREKGRAAGRGSGDGESRSTLSSITTRSDRRCRAEWALLGSSS